VRHSFCFGTREFHAQYPDSAATPLNRVGANVAKGHAGRIRRFALSSVAAERDKWPIDLPDPGWRQHGSEGSIANSLSSGAKWNAGDVHIQDARA
jgi:hypothetical protein